MSGKEAAATLARVKRFFEAVADLPDDPACREHLQALGADAAETEQVMALVAKDRAAVTHFSAPLAAVVASSGAPELKPGDRLGPWVLGAELGQGGMGQVFEAQRADGLYEQRVALKLLRGFAGEAALAQLARERRILATLSHPHIARLMDGGSTPLGRPYLVMEHVQGERIDAWCGARQLPLAARLPLFDQVCQAVVHAHGQLVVHCDIKPGNVLVGADGRAMLLDFGIAQLQGREGGEPNALTPRYASPEQLAGAPATAASDLYSLGRLLDELLAAAPDAAARADEWRAIVARATRTEPTGRYATVDALRADLRRLQAHLPLQALPRSAAYLTRKFVRRRWPWVLTGAAALLLSAVFVLQLVQERDRARQAQAQALQAQNAAEQVSDFLVSIFEGADPRRGGRPDMPVLDVVNQGRDRVDAQLREQPALQSTVKSSLARVYENLGRRDEAVALLQQAAALERLPAVNRPLEEAELLSRQAMVLANHYRGPEALEPAKQALALRATRVAADSPEMADSHNTLGWVLTELNRFDEAQPHLDQALQIRLRRLGPDHLDVAGVRHNLGMLALGRERYAEAEAQFRAVLQAKRAQLPATHYSVLSTQGMLVRALGPQHKLDEGQEVAQQVVASFTALLGPDNARVGEALHELAVLQRDAGRTEEALATYRRSMQIAVATGGARTTKVAVSLNNIGGAQNHLGDPAAEQSLRESLAIRRERLPAGSVFIARAEAALARWLLARGRIDEARPLLAQSEAARAATLPAGHGDRVESRLLQAQLALAENRRVDAEQALDGRAALDAGLRSGLRIERLRLLGHLRSDQGRPAEAVTAQRQALQLQQDKIGATHPDTARFHLELAQAQVQAGDRTGARASLAAAQALLPPHHAKSPVRAWAARLGAALKDKPSV
jgi:tetratricopeptide (TPR) repeat protein